MGAPIHPLAFVVKLVAIVALLAIAATTALAAQEPNESSEPRATIRAVGDSLSISDSLGSGAILSAANMAPGQQTSGSVTIGNTGNINGTFSLSSSNLTDSPGPNGGALSNALDLTITDGATTVYSGKLNAMPSLPLGVWAPSQAHTYNFTASLPDTGIPISPTTGDNIYKGSATTVAFNWTATGDGNPTPPDNGGGAGDGGGGGTATPLKLGVAGKSQKLKKNSMNWSVSCSESCKVAMSGAVAKQKGRKGKARNIFRVKIKPTTMTRAGKATVRLRFSKKQVKKIKAALKKRNKVWLALTATATGTSGSPVKSTAKLQIKR